MITVTGGKHLLDCLPDGTPSPNPYNLDATWILPTDCASGVLVYVRVSVTVPAGGFSNYALTAYGSTVTGTDCGVLSNRSGATGVCWQVALSPGVIGAIPVRRATYELSVRELLRNVGKAPGQGLSYAPATAAVCDLPPLACPTPLNVALVVTDLAGNVASELELAFSIDPEGVTVADGVCGSSVPADAGISPLDAGAPEDGRASEDAGASEEGGASRSATPAPDAGPAQGPGEGAGAPNGRAGCAQAGGTSPPSGMGGALIGLCLGVVLGRRRLRR